MTKQTTIVVTGALRVNLPSNFRSDTCKMLIPAQLQLLPLDLHYLSKLKFIF